MVWGTSSKFPIRGHPFGPGGNGRRVRFDTQYRGNSAKTRMITPVVESWTDMVWEVEAPQLFWGAFYHPDYIG